ncbi:MAG TPA: hypothetical protein VHU77_03150 [Candidatus Limnocylindria bacterium]|jgi:hypothetical protein|nr:hypothetical protein [Candidatus Limnocylindria bacterium]
MTAPTSPTPITDAWASVEASLPQGWFLEGIRCASSGLSPDQRSERWVAEACGPAGECEIVTDSSSPEEALEALAARLRRG